MLDDSVADDESGRGCGYDAQGGNDSGVDTEDGK